MKKRHQAGKRIAAWLMALSLCMTAVPAEQAVYAASVQDKTETAESSFAAEDAEQAEKTAVTQESEPTEKTVVAHESEMTENTGKEDASETVGEPEAESRSETTENTGAESKSETTETTETEKETETTEATETESGSETTEATGTESSSETTEATGTENGSETTEATGIEKESETTEDTGKVRNTENVENTEVTEASETTESIENEKESEITEDTEKVTEDTETEDTEAEESEDVVKKDGNVTPGNTYATAAAINVNTPYAAATSVKSITHWYKFTLSKAGMVQLNFAHAKLSDSSNTPAWKIDFIADKVGGMVSIESGLQDTEKRTAKIGLEAGTYYVQITGVDTVFVKQSYNYVFNISYEDTYCETEQNDSISTADNYTLGQTVTGSIHSLIDGDVDYYKITATAKGYLSFQLQHDKVTGRGSADIYRVEVCDSTGEKIYTMNSKADEEKTKSVNLGLAVGTYYLKVSGILYSGSNGETYRLNASWNNADNWECESNDTTAVANSIEAGKAVYGSLYALSDVDYYSMETAKDGYIVVNLQHSKITGRQNTSVYAVTVCDASGSSIYEMTSKAEEESADSIKLGLAAGKYYIKVAGLNAYYNGNYVIKTTFKECSDWEREKNDTIAAANTMKSGKAVHGNLQGLSDVDYYGFETSKDGYIVVNLQHSKVTGRQNTSVYAVTVCDASGGSIYEMTSKAEAESTDSIKLGLTAGKYYVKVEGQNAYYGGDYVIKTKFKECSTWEHESNDTYDTANTAVSGTTYSGDIRTYSDVDYFKIKLSENGYIHVKLKHPVVSGQETTNMFVISVIRKVDTDQYTEVYTTNIRGGDTSVSTPNLGLPKGEYYIKVAGTGNTAGTLLNATSYPVNYSVCIKAKKAGNREVESNDSVTTANTIKSGKTYYGSISGSKDKDYYKINMSEAGYLKVKFGHKNNGNTASCYNIVIYNKDNSEIYKFTNTGTDTSYTTCKLGLAAGKYYVCVSQASTLYTGDYTISMTQKAASGWETENNGDWASADRIEAGKAVKGVITGYTSDEDYYRFTLTKAQYINFSLAHDKIDDAGRSWYVTLYNANGRRVSRRADDHIYCYAGSTYTESQAVRLSKGTYYLKVQAYAKNAVEKEYTLCVNKIKNKKTNVTSVKSKAYNKLKVSWKVVPAVASYEIYRSTKKDGDYQKVKTIDSVGTSSWTDSSVKTGKTYYYKIKTVVKTQDGNQTSGFSNIKSAKAVPSKTTLKAKASDTKNVKLTWSKVKGANGYEIYRSNSKNGKYKKIAAISKGSTTSYKNGKLKKSTTYYYKIRAYRKVDGKKVYGNYSSVVSVKTKAK